MKTTTFKTNFVDGEENVMDTSDLNVSEIRFNIKSRQISIICEEVDVYTLEDLDGLSWQAIKNLVGNHGGEWGGKVEGINFLIGREKVVE